MTSKSSDNRLLPPQDLPAEVSLLGSMILDAGCIPDIIGLVRKNDFYLRANQIVFDALIELYDNESGIDLVILRDKLKHRKELDEVGGIDYCVELAESVPSATNAAHYAHIVQDNAIRRQLIQTYTLAVQRAYDDGETVEDLVNGLELHLTALRRSLNGDNSQFDIINLDTIESQPIT